MQKYQGQTSLNYQILAIEYIISALKFKTYVAYVNYELVKKYKILI